MAMDTAIFLVTREIAQRSGLLNVRYRTKDGRFILDSSDLSHVRIKSSEYLTGLQGVERISKEQANTLIAQNGYAMGDVPFVQNAQPEIQQPAPQEEVVEEETQEPENNEGTESTEEEQEQVEETNDKEE